MSLHTSLHDFLQTHAPLTAVEVLPDFRLINVVIGDGAVYGIIVDNIPVDAIVTRLEPVTLNDDTITAGTLTFDTMLYEMLS